MTSEQQHTDAVQQVVREDESANAVPAMQSSSLTQPQDSRSLRAASSARLQSAQASTPQQFQPQPQPATSSPLAHTPNSTPVVDGSASAVSMTEAMASTSPAVVHQAAQPSSSASSSPSSVVDAPPAKKPRLSHPRAQVESDAASAAVTPLPPVVAAQPIVQNDAIQQPHGEGGSTPQTGVSNPSAHSSASAPAAESVASATTPTRQKRPNREAARAEYIEMMGTFWEQRMAETKVLPSGPVPPVPPTLHIQRLKKLMKMDEEVTMTSLMEGEKKKGHTSSSGVIISAEAPFILSKALELFVLDLTSRAWAHLDGCAHSHTHAHMNGSANGDIGAGARRVVSRSDVADVVASTEQFDFLMDSVPRDVNIANQIFDTTKKNVLTHYTQKYQQQVQEHERVMEERRKQQEAMRAEQRRMEDAERTRQEELHRQQYMQQLQQQQHVAQSQQALQGRPPVGQPQFLPQGQLAYASPAPPTAVSSHPSQSTYIASASTPSPQATVVYYHASQPATAHALTLTLPNQHQPHIIQTPSQSQTQSLPQPQTQAQAYYPHPLAQPISTQQLQAAQHQSGHIAACQQLLSAVASMHPDKTAEEHQQIARDFFEMAQKQAQTQTQTQAQTSADGQAQFHMMGQGQGVGQGQTMQQAQPSPLIQSPTRVIDQQAGIQS